MPSAESVSVVMPSYNERENIVEAVQRIVATLGDRLLEVIIVDDNSPDRTWEVVEHLRNSKVRVIRRMNKRGLASALADGTKEATGDIIVWLDCDLGIPPEDIRKLIGALDGCDAAIGSRYAEGGADTRHWFRAFLSTVFNTYARVILGPVICDWTSGFAAVRRHVMERVPLSEQGFGDYFIEWAYDCGRHGIRIAEIPYRYGLRKGGVSKTDGSLWVFLRLAVRYAWRVITVRLKRRTAPASR